MKHNYFIRYLIHITVEFRLSLLSKKGFFRKSLVSPFNFYYHTGFTATPDLCHANQKPTPLTLRFDLFIYNFRYKKSLHPNNKDEGTVVPPLLADHTAHFSNSK